MRVLVTGATGFVGRPTCESLLAAGHEVRAAVRQRPNPALPEQVQVVNVGNVGPETDWSRALAQVDAVVHLANRAHVMREVLPDPLAEFRRVNVQGTLRLARQAAELGVKHIVYVSSIKVNGDATEARPPFSEAEPPVPLDPYGISKWEAEQALVSVCSAEPLRYTILRPPLLYGAGVKGNVERLLRWVVVGLPLPLGAIHNQRSLMSVRNLAGLIVTCLAHPRAAQQTFVCCDEQALSTAQLVRALALGLDRPGRLLPVPATLLRATGKLLGRKEVFDRLCGSLLIDDRKVRTVLGWSPPYSAADELVETGRLYREARRRAPACRER